MFLSTVKPLFSDTTKTANTIILNENDNILKDEKKVSETLNDHFTNLTKKLKLKPSLTCDSVDLFENNISIGKVQSIYQNEQYFKFTEFIANELFNNSHQTKQMY